MDKDQARTFVDQWVANWNARDLESVLSHFSDDVFFTSPLAAQLVPDSAGVIRGKAALRAYWTEGLNRSPDLHFDLVGSYVGVDTVVINYRNQRGHLINEVLMFDGPLVSRGSVAHLDPAPAS